MSVDGAFLFSARCCDAAVVPLVVKLGRNVGTRDLYSLAEFRQDRSAGRRTVAIGSGVDGAFLFSDRCCDAAVAPIVVKVGRTVETDDVHILAEFRRDRSAGRRTVAVSSWR